MVENLPLESETSMSSQETKAPARLADVAARAGVSVGTASKVLNRRGALRPETRARVLSAAEELGFVPNALARSLLSGRSFTVGLVASDVVGRFSIPVMLGVEDTLGAGRIAVLFCDGRGDPIREDHYVRSLLSRRVDGIIVAGGQTDPRPPIGRAIPVPVVYAWTPSTDPMDTSVVPDHETGAYAAVRHLLGTGHRRVGHVTGPHQFRAVELRAAGAIRALEELGLGLVPPGVLYGDWSEAWGRQVPLSTVDMDLHEVGRTAAQRLLEAIDGRKSHGIEFLPCRLLARESTDLIAASSR
jgi:LacI family transcriptional regulator